MSNPISRKQTVGVQIEGKFGQGKNGYGLNVIQAKRADTSAAWIRSIFICHEPADTVEAVLFCAVFSAGYRAVLDGRVV